jgi:hypothetical protein
MCSVAPLKYDAALDLQLREAAIVGNHVISAASTSDAQRVVMPDRHHHAGLL